MCNGDCVDDELGVYQPPLLPSSRQLPSRTGIELEGLIRRVIIREAFFFCVISQQLSFVANRDVTAQSKLRDFPAVLEIRARLPSGFRAFDPFEPVALGTTK